MNLIVVNGVELPAPDRPVAMEIASFVNAAKNANGTFVGQRVGRDQYKINNLQWKHLDAATWSKVLKLFQNFEVIVKFPDMVNNDWITLSMYPGNRTAELNELRPDGLPKNYMNCKVNIIDCGVI